MDLGHWQCSFEFDPEDWFGFIYRIIEKSSGREYIGKKQFFNIRRHAVVGKKNKKKIIKESNWRTYTSSSTHLNQAIEETGIDNYEFFIESLHKTRGSLFYAEVQAQIFEDVLRARLDDGVSRKFFNRIIPGVKFIPPDEVPAETRAKIKKSLTERYQKIPHWRSVPGERLQAAVYKSSGSNHYLAKMSTIDREAFLNSYHRGENNPMFGSTPWNKDKTYEELFDQYKSEQIKNILREKCGKSGEENGMFGKSHTDETKEKWKNNPNRIHAGEKNGMFGKPCFYKMTDEEKLKWRENISKSTKGKPKSAEFKEKLSKARKGEKRATVVCPHCQKEGGAGNMKRYHFDSCPTKPHTSG